MEQIYSTETLVLQAQSIRGTRQIVVLLRAWATASSESYKSIHGDTHQVLVDCKNPEDHEQRENAMSHCFFLSLPIPTLMWYTWWSNTDARKWPGIFMNMLFPQNYGLLESLNPLFYYIREVDQIVGSNQWSNDPHVWDDTHKWMPS